MNERDKELLVATLSRIPESIRETLKNSLETFYNLGFQRGKLAGFIEGSGNAFEAGKK